ncbi:MAG: gliding motility-associated C-terminal domain-containing protein, partial [Flavobacteriales bacterium]|nr:gliding motility-associated C-terminal domain-containing protein [Flavobacteriales bacterium]
MVDNFNNADGDGWDQGVGTSEPLDSDGDNIPNYTDLDSDNDAIADIEEAGGEDQNDDGVVDNFIDQDGDGWDDNEANDNPVDTDGDGTPDILDLDSDGDGINDIDEGGNGYADTNNDGVVDNLEDANGDGWIDGGSSTSTVPDTDGDGDPDYQDLDSDGDGIDDELENDPNGDGIGPDDTDGDGIPDYQDLDSDGDGLTDAEEWDVTGDGIGPDDCNNDGIPNYLDASLCDISIPQGFSPNGDSVNDLFVIDGLIYYPNNTMTILNRWGNKVFESGEGGYQNDWDGTNQFGVTIGGNLLPTGTYFYIFDPGREDEQGKAIEPVTGYIYLNR